MINGCFAQTDVAAYRQEGYVVLRNLLPQPAVERTRKFLEESLEASLEELREALGAPTIDSVAEQINKRMIEAEPAITPRIRHMAVGHFPPETRLSRRLWEIAGEPALLALVNELIGTQDILLHFPPTARFVLPGNRFAAVPAHQDIRYNEHLPTGFITVWTPFVEIDESCGGVIVYKNSHAMLASLTEIGGPWLGAVDTAGYPAHHIMMCPGDVLVLNERIVHASSPNVSRRVRLSTDFRFFTGRSQKPALDPRLHMVIQPGETR